MIIDFVNITNTEADILAKQGWRGLFVFDEQQIILTEPQIYYVDPNKDKIHFGIQNRL